MANKESGRFCSPGWLMPELPDRLGRAEVHQEQEPLVSVVIPVYNGERYLGEAIDSVLRQSFAGSEIIVVDDGSTDRTADVATAYGSAVRYFRQHQSGSGAARNRGIEVARGSLFAFLDADDVWTPNKLAIQKSAFDADPELELVYSHVKQFCSPELSEVARQKIRCPDDVVPGRLPGTMLVKRDSFLRVGPFGVSWGVGEGVDWHLRATELGLKMVLLPDVLLWRRLHENNLGRRQRDARIDYVRVFRAALDRRRDAQETSVETRTPHAPGED